MLLRRAQTGDAPDIARIIRTVWSDSNPDPLVIGGLLADGGRATIVAMFDGIAAGFVDAFRSDYETPSGRQPYFWEIDLLAVEPAFHGRGIGAALIAAARDMGHAAGTPCARALVRVDNVGAQIAFKRVGFVPQPEVNGLYTAGGSLTGNQPDQPAGCRMIGVDTLTYSGIWLEGLLTREAFRYGRHAAGVRGLDTVGAVIPRDDTVATGAAACEGYDHVGDFRWWTYAYTSG